MLGPGLPLHVWLDFSGIPRVLQPITSHVTLKLNGFQRWRQINVWVSFLIWLIPGKQGNKNGLSPVLIFVRAQHCESPFVWSWERYIVSLRWHRHVRSFVSFPCPILCSYEHFLLRYWNVRESQMWPDRHHRRGMRRVPLLLCAFWQHLHSILLLRSKYVRKMQASSKCAWILVHQLRRSIVEALFELQKEATSRTCEWMTQEGTVWFCFMGRNILFLWKPNLILLAVPKKPLTSAAVKDENLQQFTTGRSFTCE